MDRKLNAATVFVGNEEIKSIIHEIMKRLPELRGADVEAVPLREDEHDDE